MKKRILAIGVTISGILVVIFTIPIADFLTCKIGGLAEESSGYFMTLLSKAPTNFFFLYKVLPTLGSALIVIGVIYLLFFNKE